MSEGGARRKALAAAGTSVFFAVAPGTVAGLLPWWLTGWEVRDPLPYWTVLRMAGAMLLVAGGVVLVHAFTRFVIEGVGTPAPAAPTGQLVVGGLYRYVRNPMYLAVSTAIVGQALLLGRPELLLYAAAVSVANATFVRWYEEPTLGRQFGTTYDTYRKAVPAWLPRRHPWYGEPA